MKQVQRLLVVFAALCAAVLGGAWIWTGGSERFAGFGYGLGLFAANFFLLTLVGGRLFATVGGAPAGEGNRPVGAGVIALFLLKIVFLGLGAYVGLALLLLPALWFVVGVVAGLILVTLASVGTRPFSRVSGTA